MPKSPLELDDLIANLLGEIERGQVPDPAEFVARHPEHAVGLATFLADLGRFGGFLGIPCGSTTDLTQDFVPSEVDPATALRQAGERFAEYELLGEPVGEGGMGVVYRARLTGTSMVVALKQIRSGGVESTARFQEEIETAAGLRHPNIVPVYHVGEHGGRPFFTMALVEGGSLDRHIGHLRGHLRSSAQLVAKVARAVHYAHQRRVLHRDLKPSNILLDEAGEPHVADFGLASRLSETGSTIDAGPPAGSLPWMAPEAVRGEATLTTSVDVWALGVILYELLTGVRPFPGPDASSIRQSILSKDPIPPREINPQVPRDLDAICRRCLVKDPEGRYESASAVALELDRWLRDEPVRARRSGRGERFLRWCRRNPGAAAGTSFLASLLVAITLGSVRVANDLEEEVVATVCRNNEYDASQVAGNVARKFDQLGSVVKDRAAELSKNPENVDDAESGLQSLATSTLKPGGTRLFVNAFLLDPEGVIRASWTPDAADPRKTPTLANFPGRDYFVHAGKDQVHVSRVFRSENDTFDKLALSIRFRPLGATKDWVLAATVTTDERLDLGVASMSDDRHTAFLVAPRDSQPPRPGAPSDAEEYVILVHPALSPRSPSIRFGTDSPGESRSFPADRDYRDPLAAKNPSFAGRWLTGSAPVGDTHLVVVVEQRYDQAVGPHRSSFRRFVTWIAGAVVIGMLAFASLKLLRRIRTSAA